MRLSTPGLVLRDYKYETNRILTLLTKEQGVLTAFANRANLPTSQLAGSTELLCYSDFVLFKNRKGDFIVNEADSIRTFFPLRARYEDLALASYLAQLFNELSPVLEPAPSYVQLLLGCLHHLEVESRPPKQIKAIGELRVLTMSGYMPDLVGCQSCGQYSHKTMFFTPTGELFCSNCVGEQDRTEFRPLTEGVLAAMRHIVYAPPKKVFSFSLSEKGLVTLAQVVESFLLYQLEKTLPTLEFYRSITDFTP